MAAPRDETQEVVRLSPDALRKQKARNRAIAFALAGLAILFFLVTIAKLGPGVMNRPL